jgi:hypothetical protein
MDKLNLPPEARLQLRISFCANNSTFIKDTESSPPALPPNAPDPCSRGGVSISAAL